MRTIRPIPSIKVTIDGDQVDVFRQELLNDPQMGNLLTDYERVLNELAEIEYEASKLHHAKVSMQANLQNLALQYVHNKNKSKDEEKGEEA